MKTTTHILLVKGALKKKRMSTSKYAKRNRLSWLVRPSSHSSCLPFELSRHLTARSTEQPCLEIHWRKSDEIYVNKKLKRRLRRRLQMWTSAVSGMIPWPSNDNSPVTSATHGETSLPKPCPSGRRSRLTARMPHLANVQT